ncbi:elongation factor P maturation arginine rhamnosyltransferase EarP [Bordetella genomosp. 11]|uniref:Protein-arginine rhamnosyltransferase n=1 Tax=Bordetella genomosp. 11 TaxID=1416808 RepID=A0A261UMX5_9BORD|nr:elongation factor P maturation arginine rhamnosyltransferase EarP [Bordetella genomosp. 11]OZI63248.1 hypothetical protein CAL28_08890 [Bordetella genomosp. 11]
MHADIFCRRVDNYGDVGVCWRLARQLHRAAGWRVRLWIDDLAAFARMEPRCEVGRPIQDIAGITVVAWSAQPPALPPGDVVIEAFACDPPEAFRVAMRQRPPIWINLEYLSAEAWVESHHGLPSPQPDGLMKYFFFPGFTPATGGLLREPDLAGRRDAFQASPQAQRTFLRELGVPAPLVARWLAPTERHAGHRSLRLASLFCYPDAPLEGLVEGLRADPTPSVLLVPEGVAPRLETVAGRGTAPHIARIPFLPQDDYDRVLWCADLNFVRGEDSVVRAGWARRPLLWHIYPQADDVHLHKLDAWLDRYRPPLPARTLFHAWNTGAAPAVLAQAWRDAMAEPCWSAWGDTARTWDDTLSSLPDLATRLIRFCADLRQKC